MPKKSNLIMRKKQLIRLNQLLQFQHHHFLVLKNKLQIHGLPFGLWNKRMNSVGKNFSYVQKTEKLVLVPAIKFELLESRQKWA
jgi:hypothetical protein